MARRAADAMTEEENAAIIAAAKSDPDAQPLTQEQVARMRPEPFVRTVRLELGLSIEDFADRYGIPVANIRAWEFERRKPSAGMMSLLEMIEADPEGLAKARKKAEARKVREMA